MFDWFSPNLVGSVTPSALLLLFAFIIVRAFIKGDIVPRTTFDIMRGDRDATIKRIMGDRDERLKQVMGVCDDWKTAYQLAEQSRQKSVDALSEITDLARTSNALIRALRDVVEEGDALDDGPI